MAELQRLHPAQAAAESAYAPAAIAAATPVGQRTSLVDRPRQMKRKGSSPKQQSASKQVCGQSVTSDLRKLFDSIHSAACHSSKLPEVIALGYCVPCARRESPRNTGTPNQRSPIFTTSHPSSTK